VPKIKGWSKKQYDKIRKYTNMSVLLLGKELLHRGRSFV